MKRFAVGYEFVCRIILMVFVVHMAFIVHTLLGLVVGGLFPSIAACYGTYRRWLQDVDDRSWSVKHTWLTFHASWRSELKSANILGWPQFLVMMLLAWEYWITMHNDMGVVGIGISGVLLVLNLIYGLFVSLSWAIHVNFDGGLWWTVKTSLSMVIARPLCSLMVLLLFIITVWAYYTWPGLAVVFGMAVPAFATMMAVYSWGRVPGMDVHELEPSEKDQHRRNDDLKR
ncbi:Uncharacterized membrane protein YesL [Bifidobacterium bohemicum]|uniref:Drug resistance transporter EmrB/QacA subfamily protein n=1 Tax=Bifidobacterium bohemicum DSM 22767 TaxID=1437606 RepID=A0A086ZGI0_9BIFI|nr:DUF624 domain-containing protein [Bifidobacterium bohemicum]KFI45630.1 hypothetical protein BBOH_0957 [Bifidobacterium bohemicum DSM 22767]SCC00145.1 Uncharacterized membrane protein YesL [Bifidobacterium bohemicum]